ncbi:MAG TPA: glycosyltransferase family 39 protein [Candidatus Baltobacteraceae bacterium]|jgi:4-amino-4-deoxy-L-arabinose transferase-like glycosyltransferase
MRRRALWISLGFIVLLGAALRLYQLGAVPTELTWDELDLYNSAHSIATTGHDIDGTLLPYLYCPIARNPPIYAIAGYASSLVLGATPFGLRFPAVIFGLITVLLVFGIARELTGRRDVALLAALLTATGPIFIHFSRVAWEPTCELPFLLGGLYALLRTFRRADEDGRPGRPSTRGLAIGALLLGLTAYTYMAGWFYSVSLGLGLLALNWFRFRDRRALGSLGLALAVWAIVAAPALWVWFFDPHTTQWTGRLSTFAGGVNAQTLGVFAHNYLAHFRWSYLVTTGDPQPGLTWRYLDGFGALFGWVVPLAALGALAAFRYVRTRWAVVFTYAWLALYPFGGALTDEGAPNATRTLAGMPVFCILAAIAIAMLFDLAARPRDQRDREVATGLARVLLIGGMIWGLVSFSTFYFVRYNHVNSNAWYSGSSAMFAALLAHASYYDRICYAVLPAWFPTQSYTLFYFRDRAIEQIPYAGDPACSKPGTLIAADQHHPVTAPGFLPIATIRDVDGSIFANISGRPR